MKTETLTIGLDLGDRQHHACVLDAAGEILAEDVIVNSREVLTAFLARYPRATVVMETGTHSPWVSRVAAAQRHPVIVANAQMLARLGRADPKLLSPGQHRYNQLSHDGGQREFGGFSFIAETLIEGFEDRVVPGGSERGHVEDPTDRGAAAVDVAQATELAAIAG